MTTPRRVVPIVPEPPSSVSMYVREATIHPRAVHGRYAVWRWLLVWATQLLYYGLPWLGWNGRPLMLFDLEARRFYIGGLVLYPQDFIYLTVLLILSAYALFLFTAVAGRLWCGYACPQTVYTEIFLWIERRCEGDRLARMRLDAAPWSAAKLVRRGGKHLAWLAVGLWTGFTFVGYFTPIRTLAAEAAALALGPWELFWVLFYGFATYGNAGFLREQVCKYMCPYARFQSAMFDKDTLVISYDPLRGEPRGARSRKADRAGLALGDCVDCTLCVQVCPTGIDIRQGLQHECIGCAACIDACNGVMDKIGYPRGLIRYATQRGLASGSARFDWRRVLRPRVLIYGTVLFGIAIAFVASLAWRPPVRVDVVRDRGALARLVEDSRVENVYRLQLMNVVEAPQRYRIDVEGLPGAEVVLRDEVRLGPAEARWVPVAVRIAPETALALGPGVHALGFVVTREADGADAAGRPAASLVERSTFVVPR